MAAGSGGGGGGFEIAKAFVTIEARFKDDTFRALNDRLKGGPGGGGDSGNSGAYADNPSSPSRQKGNGALVTQDAHTGTPKPVYVTNFPQNQGQQSHANATSSAAAMQAQQQAQMRTQMQAQVQQAQQQIQAATSKAMANVRPDQQYQRPTTTTATQAGPAQRFPQPAIERDRQALAMTPQRALPAPSRALEMSRGSGSGAKTVNNYNTRVQIDPRKIDELLAAIRAVNQLKARNRAHPKGAPGFNRSGAESHRTLTDFEQQAVETLADNATVLHMIRVGKMSLAGLGLDFLVRAGGDRILNTFKIKQKKRKRQWRESRHTRYKSKSVSGVDKTGDSPSGFRRKGQFYFNRKFKGAKYKDFETQNSAEIEAALTRAVVSQRATVANTGFFGPGFDDDDDDIDFFGAAQPEFQGQAVGNLSEIRIQNRWRDSTAKRGMTGKTGKGGGDGGGSSKAKFKRNRRTPRRTNTRRRIR